MAIFNSYVSLPEGNSTFDIDNNMWYLCRNHWLSPGFEHPHFKYHFVGRVENGVGTPPRISHKFQVPN